MLFTGDYPFLYKNISPPAPCVNQVIEVTVPHKDYPLDKLHSNSTFLLTLYQFHTPFVFKVTATSHLHWHSILLSINLLCPLLLYLFILTLSFAFTFQRREIPPLQNVSLILVCFTGVVYPAVSYKPLCIFLCLLWLFPEPANCCSGYLEDQATTGCQAQKTCKCSQ